MIKYHLMDPINRNRYTPCSSVHVNFVFEFFDSIVFWEMCHLNYFTNTLSLSFYHSNNVLSFMNYSNEEKIYSFRLASRSADETEVWKRCNYLGKHWWNRFENKQMYVDGESWINRLKDAYSFFKFKMLIKLLQGKPNETWGASSIKLFLCNLWQNSRKLRNFWNYEQIYGQNLAVTINP